MRILHGLIRNIQESVVLGPLFPLRHVARLLGITKVCLSTRIGKIYLRSCQGSDASSFYHIFVRKTYDLDKFPHSVAVNKYYTAILRSGKQPVIIDAGANVGAASIWFMRRYPESKILSIEPDANNIAILRSNTQIYTNVTVVAAAIGGSVGKVRIIADESGRSDRIQSVRQKYSDTRDGINLVTMDYLIQIAGKNAELFIVKIDIEGFESDLFTNDIRWLANVPVIMIELHDWMFPLQNTSTNFIKAIATHNFEILISEDTLVCVNTAICLGL